MKNKSKGKQVVPTDMPSLNAGFSTELLGKALRSKRTSLGMRVDDIADRLGVSRITVMKIEKGNSAVTFSHILKYLDVVGLSLQLRDLTVTTDIFESFYIEHNDLNSHAKTKTQKIKIPQKESWLDKFNTVQREFFAITRVHADLDFLHYCVSILQSSNSLEMKAVKLKPYLLKMKLLCGDHLTNSFLSKLIHASSEVDHNFIESLVEFVTSDDFKEHYKGGVVNTTEGWFGAK
ncbi:helix-turn-helix domain-containing protein [Photobacterium leiognathi]|uniref:helix-turn-helix domain-containing protein n=1 Tax=Photobacterium leiognathi TaxID=553611 RepID=UPI00273A2492|nr:helix-turn-helix transcriptional regulator [Photobacterium leiognathi]